MILTAQQVMDSAAALLNSSALGGVFSYASQMPYLNIAMEELQEYAELNNIPVTDKSEYDIPVAIGLSELNFTDIPKLPRDLIEIQVVYDRLAESDDQYLPLTRCTFLPSPATPIAQLVYWTWQDQKILFIPATTEREVRLDYIRSIFTPVVDKSDTIAMINCKSYLEFRTAALISEFIGENPTRAGSLNGMAGAALERSMNIGVKGQQAIAVRRRPFNQNYKSYGGGYVR